MKFSVTRRPPEWFQLFPRFARFARHLPTVDSTMIDNNLLSHFHAFNPGASDARVQLNVT